MLEALGPGATVAFEVDGSDAVSETGWSVLLKGHASEIDPPGAPAGRRWSSSRGRRAHETTGCASRPWSVTGRAISRDHRLPHGHSVPYMPPD